MLLPAAPAEVLSAAVSATALLRLALAAALAVLTAAVGLLGGAADAPGAAAAAAEQQPWAGLAAAWDSQLQRLPALANLAVLDASIIAAAFLLLRSRPALVRTKVGCWRCCHWHGMVRPWCIQGGVPCSSSGSCSSAACVATAVVGGPPISGPHKEP